MAVFKGTQPMLETLQLARRKWYPLVRNLALDAGVLGGHSDYRRFIVLGRSRVGSNFLRGLLNAHPQIMVYGELFQDNDKIRWALPGFRQSPKALRQWREQPVGFLQERIFRAYPKPTAAVGFKIFYYHAADGAWRAVWDWLRDQRALHVIHLKRHNVLETHLSRQRALATKVWVSRAQPRPQHAPLVLDYRACLEDFERTRAWEQQYDTMFAAHARLELSYEELAAGYSQQMERIQQFLGLERSPVQPETFKQARRPLSSDIANYHELKQRFAGTRWAEFFVD